METTKVKTFTATIYCGYRKSYSDEMVDSDLGVFIAKEVCSVYCNEIGMGVTLEKIQLVYKNGWENGIKVGLINYPRFPMSNEDIKEHAINIAKKLKEKFLQERVSIVCTDETIMLGEK